MAEKETRMKRLFIIVILAALALSGCATTGFLGFLATTEYVDGKAKSLAEQQAVEIEQLRAELKEYQAVKEQAQAAMDEVNKTTQTVQTLQEIAKKAEDRISAIPKEVIRQMIDALQAILDK